MIKRNGSGPKTRMSPLGPRQLTLLYYFDSRRTKSLRVPMPYLVAAASVGALLLLWTLISPFLIFEYRKQLAEKDRRVTDLLAKIFDYQTKYENVFEKAYPPSERAPQANVASHEDASKPAGLDLTAPVEEEFAAPAPTPAAQPTTPQAPAKTAAPATPPPKAAAAPDTRHDAVPVNLEKMTTHFTTDKMVVNFALKNLANPAKTEGTIMGVAVYEKTGGGRILVTNPPNHPLKDDGSPRSMRSAVGYSIRYYKSKGLAFDRPREDGRFTSLTIFVAGKEDGPTKTFVFSLNDVPTKAEAKPDARKADEAEDEPEDAREGDGGADSAQPDRKADGGERAGETASPSSAQAPNDATRARH